MMTLSVAEILNELAQVGQQADTPEGFLTIPELCLSTGWGESKLRRSLKLAKAAGQLEVRRTMQETLAGTLHPVPVYRVIPPKKGKK